MKPVTRWRRAGFIPLDLPDRAITLRNVSATNHPWYWIRWYVLENLMPTALIRTTGVPRTTAPVRWKDQLQVVANWAWDVHQRRRSPDAVLLHGCKDGSLIELFKAELRR
jgi:hypothetical protein